MGSVDSERPRQDLTPGWYPDPVEPGRYRYWDGGWTSTVSPPVPGAQPTPAPDPGPVIDLRAPTGPSWGSEEVRLADPVAQALRAAPPPSPARSAPSVVSRQPGVFDLQIVEPPGEPEAWHASEDTESHSTSWRRWLVGAVGLAVIAGLVPGLLVLRSARDEAREALEVERAENANLRRDLTAAEASRSEAEEALESATAELESTKSKLASTQKQLEDKEKERAYASALSEQWEAERDECAQTIRDGLVAYGDVVEMIFDNPYIDGETMGIRIRNYIEERCPAFKFAGQARSIPGVN